MLTLYTIERRRPPIQLWPLLIALSVGWFLGVSSVLFVAAQVSGVYP